MTIDDKSDGKSLGLKPIPLSKPGISKPSGLGGLPGLGSKSGLPPKLGGLPKPSSSGLPKLGGLPKISPLSASSRIEPPKSVPLGGLPSSSSNSNLDAEKVADVSAGIDLSTGIDEGSVDIPIPEVELTPSIELQQVSETPAPVIPEAAPEAAPVIPEAAPVIPEAAAAPVIPEAAAAPVIPEAAAAPVIPEAAPVIPEAAPVIPEAAPVIPEAAPVIPEAAPVIPEAAPVIPEAAAAPVIPEAAAAPVIPEVAAAPVIPEAAPAPAMPDFSADPLLSSEPDFEDDEEEDLGEKTMMLQAADDEDEDLEELDGEKTQIQMSAIDFDPLTGKLIVESGKTPQREYMLVRDKTTLGRGSKNDICIPDISMSRNHVVFEKFNEGFRLKDLDSGNGTCVNDYRIRSAQLRNGDIIEIGNVRFRFEQSGGDPDELWKGEPKIDYHPQQKKNHAAPSSSASSPAAPAPAPGVVASSVTAPLSPPSGQAPAVNGAQNAAEMESLVQRAQASQPAWMPPMTNPYLMSYANASLVRKPKTTPTWAYILIIISLLCLVGAGVAFLLGRGAHNAQKAEVMAYNEAIDSARQMVKTGSELFSKRRWNEAEDTFNNIKTNNEALTGEDAEQLKSLIDTYMAEISKEKDVDFKMKDALDQRRLGTIKSLEDSIDVLSQIPPASLYYDEAQARMDDTKKEYAIKLKDEIRHDISNSKFSSARQNLSKLKMVDGTERDVNNLTRLLTEKEKQNR